MEKLKWKLYSDIGTTARVYKAQDRFDFYIKKVYRNEIRNEIFEMEKEAIQIVKGEKHFTKKCFIDEKNKTIYMDYLGKTLCKENCPKNWKEQINEILDILEKLDLYISDFQRNNICISGKTINLIDFGVVKFKSFNREYLYSRLSYVFENLMY